MIRFPHYLRPVLLSLMLAFGATAALAESQLMRNVRAQMPSYVPGVDVSTLSNGHLGSIYNIMNGSDSRGKKVALIKSILRRSNALPSQSTDNE